MRLLLITAGLVVASAPAMSQQSPAFCAASPGARPPAQLLPIDEASRQLDFFTFRARLQTAVAARDVDAVIAAADPNIRLGFGGDDGAKRLRERLSAADAAPYWRVIARVLALGGAFKGEDSFHAPYYYANWPDAADSYECGVIIGRAVNVRREPRTDAAIVASVSYALVGQSTAVPANPAERWTAIDLRDGREGYVLADYVGSPLDLRALFNRVNGRWRLTALVAGD